ncbi:MAG: exosortase/archaeosortase family protein [Armatimonadota bacterium]|jgi:exosortase
MDDATGHPPATDEQAPTGERSALFTPLTALVVVLLVACFWSYMNWMWAVWMKSDYYGHGPLIPLISAYLIYSRRREFIEAAGGRELWGLGLLLPGMVFFLAAVYLDVNFIQGFAMVMVIGGLIILLWGWGRARVVLFPVAFLMFMVPVDRLLVTQFSNPLQTHAATVAARSVAMVGMPVEQAGTTIRIPDYTFEVAQACSGLKSTIAMSALAALFAYLARGPVWKRVLLFIAGAPIALAANATRITFTLILGRAFGSEAAEGFFHTLSGLMVFVLALIGLFIMARLLKCDRMREDIW